MSTRTSLGPSLQLSAAYQLLSSVELSLSALGFTAQREREDSSLRICPLGLMPSVTYQLDIVRFIPYLGVGVGYSVDALDTSNNGGVVAPVLGVDYLLTREWRVGVQYRPSWYLSLELPTPTHQALMRVQLGSGW